MVLWCALIPTLSAQWQRRPGLEMEIVLRVFIGSFIAFGDTVAEIRAESLPDFEAVIEAVRNAICLEEQRDLENDPSYGIEQLTTIGWTSISTAKSNPFPGLLVIQSLRALLARWSAEQADDEAEERATPKLPVVYTDNVFARLLGSFETLAVVTSESMQPQTMAEIIRALQSCSNVFPPMSKCARPISFSGSFPFSAITSSQWN